MAHGASLTTALAGDNGKIKALYTKLLLILTRCSRLLVTERGNLFATEPRNQRYQGGLSFTAAQHKGERFAPRGGGGGGGQRPSPHAPHARPTRRDATFLRQALVPIPAPRSRR